VNRRKAVPSQGPWNAGRAQRHRHAQPLRGVLDHRNFQEVARLGRPM